MLSISCAKINNHTLWLEVSCSGVAVVSHKSSWLKDKVLFQKMVFVAANQAKLDFELLVYKFDNKSPDFKQSAPKVKPRLKIKKEAD